MGPAAPVASGTWVIRDRGPPQCGEALSSGARTGSARDACGLGIDRTRRRSARIGAPANVLGSTIAMMRLIDPHAHLNADRFAHDVELVVGAAKLAGIERMLIPGWNVASSERALELAERWPWLDASVGIHPHDAAKVDDAGWARIERWAADERVSAIGETGLDSDRLFSPWDAQLENLRRNLALARATGKPAILHCRSKDGRRDAQDALVEEVDRAGLGLGSGGVRRSPGGGDPFLLRAGRLRPSDARPRARDQLQRSRVPAR